MAVGHLANGRSFGTAVWVAIASIGLLALLATLPSANAVNIVSPGPLTNLEMTPDTKCQVQDTFTTGSGEYFAGGSPGACATFIGVAGTLYGATAVPAGGGASPVTAFTAVGQTGPTGAGTTASPYQTTTTVQAGATGLQLVQKDVYVTGDATYLTYLTVTNTGAAPVTFTMWRANDCYPNGQDYAYGYANAAVMEIACTTIANAPSPGYEILWRTPTTPPATYMEASYGTIWSQIGSQAPFPNTCTCATNLDAGIGLSWQATVAPGAQFIACIQQVYSNAGGQSGCVPPPPTPPEANYQWSQPVLCEPVILFGDLSVPYPGQTIASWSWDFGDGTTGSGPNPTHTFPGPGPWTVRLTVTDSDGETDMYVTDVTLCVPPEADFIAVMISPCDTEYPYMQFLDGSTDADGFVVAWEWDFGDGQTSTDQSPILTFGNDPVELSVTLTVMDDLGSMATTTLTIYFPGLVPCPLANAESQEQTPEPTPPQDGVVPSIAIDDADGDGVEASLDNCPTFANPDQGNADGDHAGDVCDADADNDARFNAADNCWLMANTAQGDEDEDGDGDACDLDADNDGIPDLLDVCRNVPDPGQADADADGVGDACIDTGAGDEGAQVPLAAGAASERATAGDQPLKAAGKFPVLPVLGVGVLALLLLCVAVLAIVRRRAA